MKGHSSVFAFLGESQGSPYSTRIGLPRPCRVGAGLAPPPEHRPHFLKSAPMEETPAIPRYCRGLLLVCLNYAHLAKTLCGRNALTTPLGASTTSQSFRSTITLHNI